MHSMDSESSTTPEAPAISMESRPRIDIAHDARLSPTIQRSDEETIPAYEVKFVIAEEIASELERWAEHHLQRDAFADLDNGGSYQTTTLYLDTANLDVFHKTDGFRGQKFRLRRYGDGHRIFLERKARRGNQVRKKRSDITMGDLRIFQFDGAPVDWAGLWFRDRIALQILQPTCRITYQRTAFIGSSDRGPVRLTFDRQIRGVATKDWDLPVVDLPADQPQGILPGRVICEFKFRDILPKLFQDTIAALKLEEGSLSKYGHVMTAAGWIRKERSGNA